MKGKAKPKIRLELGFGSYHLFIGTLHDPRLCPECIRPGTLKPTPKEQV